MAHREVGSDHHELFPVQELDGAPRVECPMQGHSVLFSECQSCEHGTVVRVKGAALPFVLCPSDGPAHGLMPGAPDAEVITLMKPVVTVRREQPVEALIRTFMDEGVTVAVVVDDLHRAVGLVTRNHIVLDHHGWTELRDAALSMWPADSQWHGAVESESELFLHDFLRSRTAGDLMSRGVAYLRPDARISAAAKAMARTQLKHLPVLDEENRPIGMVSSLDIAQWVASREA